MNKIKKYRNSLGLTVRQLSEKANVAVGYISTLENDKDDKTNPTKDVMEKISKVLGQTVVEIFF